MASNSTVERWQQEASYFDKAAIQAAESADAIDPLAIARYANPRVRRRFNKEFRFRLMGDIRGKSILDVGCGCSDNAVLLAKLGAHVTGVDISPKAVELGEKRAQMAGVADSVRLICSPVETVQLPLRAFDVIWGDSVLHHLINEMDAVLAKLVQLAKPGALMIFSEPVNLNHLLRRFRLMLPVRIEGTPDERPLETQEIAIIRKHVPDVKLRFFEMLGRLDRYVLIKSNYERSPAPRRFVSNLLASIDWVTLSIPGFRNLAGQAVLWGTADEA